MDCIRAFPTASWTLCCGAACATPQNWSWDLSGGGPGCSDHLAALHVSHGGPPPDITICLFRTPSWKTIRLSWRMRSQRCASIATSMLRTMMCTFSDIASNFGADSNACCMSSLRLCPQKRLST
eukprot:4976235-Pyramimonas_sp.AAC.1